MTKEDADKSGRLQTYLLNLAGAMGFKGEEK